MSSIAYLTSRFPYPLNKGDKLRVFHFLKELSVSEEVHLICLTSEPVPPEHMDVLREFCATVHVFEVSKVGRLWSLVLSVFRRIPLQVAYFYDSVCNRQIKATLRKLNPDFIHCHLIRMYEYTRKETRIPISVDFMDAFSLGMRKRMEETSNPFRKLLFWYEAKLLLNYERKVMARTSSHCIISPQDGEAIQKSGAFTIVPNGVDYEQFYPRDCDKEYDLVFMGNMTYPPNIVAVEYMLGEVMPEVWRSKQDTNILIAGMGIPNSLRQYRDERITLQERFNHISDSIACARVMVAPMLVSIGLQNKIIQAMAMKVPCITTPDANLAIQASPDEEIALAASPTQFADKVLTLLSDKEVSDQIAERAYHFVKNKFCWTKQSARLLDVIRMTS